MYSSIAFRSWLHALIKNKVDFETFIEGQNSEVHIGWEKMTLLGLFSHDDRSDLHFYKSSICSDCGTVSSTTEPVVQPYWRFLFERIQRRLHPYDPAQVSSRFNEDRNADHDSLREGTSNLTDLAPKPDTMGDVPIADLKETLSECKYSPFLIHA